MSASKYAVETVADYGDLCGILPHGETQTLYWTDIAGKRLCRCTWPERHHQIIHEQLEISGIALNTASRFARHCKFRGRVDLGFGWPAETRREASGRTPLRAE